jgi:SLOG family YspA-like protein
MRILVTGDRHYNRGDYIASMFKVLTDGIQTTKGLLKLNDMNTIIEGGASGADSLAGQFGTALGWEIDVYEADWNRYGRGAGPKRNKLMYEGSNPDVVLAFHRRIMDSRGTKHMVNYVLKQKDHCPVILVWGDPEKAQWIELILESLELYKWKEHP